MTREPDSYRGDDTLLLGIILGMLAFWLFAQTTLNIAPAMARGSGLYEMASSLGASFGVAIAAAIFTALSAESESTHWLEGVITFTGRQDNVAVRQAAPIALAFNLLMVVAAIVSIMLTVPKGRKGEVTQ